MSRTEKTKLLIDATRSVIEREGIRGTTTRAISAMAGESLGTLTYYYPSLQALIEATIRDTMRQHLHEARAWFADHDHADPADLIAGWFTTLTGEQAEIERGYVLYLAAIAEPSLRALASEWIEGYVEILTALLGDRAPATMIDGLLDACFVRRMLSDAPTPELNAHLQRSVAGILTAYGISAPRPHPAPQ